MATQLFQLFVTVKTSQNLLQMAAMSNDQNYRPTDLIDNPSFSPSHEDAVVAFLKPLCLTF